MTIYETVTASVPTGNEKGHLMKTQKLPKYVAWNSGVQLYVTFDENPSVINGLLQLKFARTVLTHRSTPSCVSALLSRNAPEKSKSKAPIATVKLT